MKRIYVLWVVAILITIGSAYYQRLTGPTHPQEIQYSIEGKQFKQNLLRSCSNDKKAEIVLKNKNISAELYYKHYPTRETEDWLRIDFSKNENNLSAIMPNQPPAGKLIYYIKIYKNNIPVFSNKESPIIIRFKGAVPDWILILHVLFMFSGMLFANMSGLLAVLKFPQARVYTFITLIIITIGGMILGPIVQKFAFGDLWTGIPKGWDLTDNKTLIAFIFWIIAVLSNFKKTNFAWIILASIVTLVIYSIPHSLFGSTLNRETGEVIQATLFFCIFTKIKRI